MAKAYILISTSPGSEEEVLRDLEAIPEVKKTYTVDGVYDIVVHLDAGTMEELENAVSTKIAGIEEFRSSMTLVIR